jgi:hypothetical protein
VTRRALHLGLAAAAATLALATVAAPAFAEEQIGSLKTTLVEANAPLGSVAVSGIVAAAPSGETFTIEAGGGSTYTINASPSTTYSKAHPLPGEAANPPTLADVFSGDFVGVAGKVSATTVSATAVVISTPQAGGHPDLITSFELEDPGSPEAAQNVIFNAPTGVFGNPFAITHCSASDFALGQCPPNSQAGLITLRANYKGDSNYLLGTAPVYSIVPQAEEETARFSFVVPSLGIPIAIPVAVRTTGDYGLRFTVKDITQLTPLAAARLTLWGFPAAKDHQPERFSKGSPGNQPGCPGAEGPSCVVFPGAEASIEPQPLTDNPTICSGQAPTSTLEVETYADPQHRSKATSTYPPIDGCEREVFKPVLQASPTTHETDSASGLELDLAAPQFLTKAAAPSEIKAVIVTLPEGFTVNPDAADGQTECKAAQVNFGSEGPAECPDTSKIGTFSIGTPALPERLQGDVFIGEPKPGDQYRLYLTSHGFGINSKLVGSVKPNPLTGRLTAEFLNLPQAPFEDFQLHLFSGERGLMATPTHCTIHQVSAVFYPWNATQAEQTTSQSFGLTSGPHGGECPGQKLPFAPSLLAGTSNATAGAFSSFSLRLGREDGDQTLGKLDFTLPPGLIANLRGISYCPEAAIAAAAQAPGRSELSRPSCPASAEIGTSNVAAGPGTHPFHAYGRIYFAGPFQGAPLSLVAITPALAGPYDYGTVVVRVALHVDPLDAHVFADSETVPSIIGGIPLRMRSIQVNIDKPNFMIDPTNCDSHAIASQGIGSEGTIADFSSPFQAVNCATLPFKPKMTVRTLGGHKSTRRSVNPSLGFDLTTRPGDANVKSIAVTLSNALEIDQSHLGNICSEKELPATQCAGRQAIGTATTTTPLLDQPLAGPVYAVSGSGGLPRLAFLLGGQVNILPRADTKTVGGGRLQTTAPVIPDAPIGHFHFTLFGGKQGYLVNTRSICVHIPITEVAFTAQNGKKLTQKVKTKASCGRKKAKKSRHRRG